MTFRIHQGDALSVLPTLDAGSVQCCVTSPPYWGLRDYGIDGQLGLEPTPDAYVASMVAVFREVDDPEPDLWFYGSAPVSRLTHSGSQHPDGPACYERGRLHLVRGS